MDMTLNHKLSEFPIFGTKLCNKTETTIKGYFHKDDLVTCQACLRLMGRIPVSKIPLTEVEF
jgi:hypothetical protein